MNDIKKSYLFLTLLTLLIIGFIFGLGYQKVSIILLIIFSLYLLYKMLFSKKKDENDNNYWNELIVILKTMKYEFIILTIYFIVFIYVYNSLKIRIDDAAYFYTLSTISQTLAALIGIVGIFIIFKLEMLKNERKECILRFREILESDMMKSGYDRYKKRIPYNNLFKNISNYFENLNIDDDFIIDISYDLDEIDLNYPHNRKMKKIIRTIGDLIDDIQTIDEQIYKIPKQFLYRAYSGFFTIILSILALPFGKITMQKTFSPNFQNFLYVFDPETLIVGIIVGFAILSLLTMRMVVMDVKEM